MVGRGKRRNFIAQVEQNRLLALEGLRGVAAIMVVIYHALLCFYGYMFIGGQSGFVQRQNAGFEDNLYASPAMVLVSGTFAVGLFFVLSGFVLSYGFFKTGDVMVVRKLAAKRYLRLMIPALVSVLLAWFLLSAELSFVQKAQPLTGSVWLGFNWNFTPNFFDAVVQGVWGIFVTTNNYYNPVLWTMLYEFAGSFLVFAFLLLFGNLRSRWILYVGLIVLTAHTWLLAFVLGTLLADCYVSGKSPFRGLPDSFLVLGLLAGLVLGAMPAGVPVGTLYDSFATSWLTYDISRSLFVSVGSALVIVGVLTLPRVSKALAHPFMARLGTYTFSLYLTHKLVLFTLSLGLFIVFLRRFGLDYNLSVALSLLISLPVFVLVAYLFERYIDLPSIQLSGRVANRLLDLPQRVGTEAYPRRPSAILAARTKLRDVIRRVPRQ